MVEPKRHSSIRLHGAHRGLTSVCVRPTNAPVCFTRISQAVLCCWKFDVYHLSTGWETGRQGGQGIKLVTEISDRSRLGGNDRVAISLPFMEWPLRHSSFTAQYQDHPTPGWLHRGCEA